jgi:hypothetical protein
MSGFVVEVICSRRMKMVKPALWSASKAGHVEIFLAEDRERVESERRNEVEFQSTASVISLPLATGRVRRRWLPY